MQVTGIDRLFLAPELYRQDNKVSELNDVWSIGVMLYLLITGGSDDKRSQETFDFREQQWMSVSTELVEFIKACVTSDPKRRSPVRDLLKNIFIKQHEQDRLDKTPLEETNLDIDGISLYKFQVATVIN